MLISKLIKHLALTAFLLLSLFAGQAQATNWTYTISGTISSGTDSIGIFGAAGANLAGLAYSQSIIVDPGQYAHQITNSLLTEGYGTLPTGSTAIDTVTVNGVTQSYILDLTQYNFGQFIHGNELTQGITGSFDEIRHAQL